MTASLSACAGGFSSSANPAASPIEIPSRAASNGRQGPGAFRLSEWKPYSVVRHSESAPPTMAASHNPASIMRAALPNVLAVDAHAQETTKDGPVMPSRSDR